MPEPEPFLAEMEAFWIVLELARQNILPAEIDRDLHERQTAACTTVRQLAVEWRAERELTRCAR
jgi:hypothetical protein